MSDTRSNIPDHHFGKDQKRENPERIREMYLRFFNPLFRYGCSIEANEALVKDEIQELFIWLLRNPQKLANIRNIETYLFKSLRRNIRAKLQSRKAKKGKLLQQPQENSESPCGNQAD